MPTINDLKKLIDSGVVSKEDCLDKLMKKVDKNGRINCAMSQCWISCGAPSSGGYGQISIHYVGLHTHRLSHWLHNDLCNMPKRMDVAHKCDNPTCCNPDHLELIPHSKNIKDAIDRGLRIIPLKESIRTSVACIECRKQKRERCIPEQDGSCERCTRLGFVCAVPVRRAHLGDFKKGMCSGESNSHCKLSGLKFDELKQRLKSCRRGEIVTIAHDYGISYGYAQHVKAGRIGRGSSSDDSTITHES